MRFLIFTCFFAAFFFQFLLQLQLLVSPVSCNKSNSCVEILWDFLFPHHHQSWITWQAIDFCRCINNSISESTFFSLSIHWIQKEKQAPQEATVVRKEKEAKEGERKSHKRFPCASLHPSPSSSSSSNLGQVSTGLLCQLDKERVKVTCCLSYSSSTLPMDGASMLVDELSIRMPALFLVSSDKTTLWSRSGSSFSLQSLLRCSYSCWHE